MVEEALDVAGNTFPQLINVIYAWTFRIVKRRWQNGLDLEGECVTCKRNETHWVGEYY